ncbi:acylphosphatase [Tepidamorphus gemmatus]|uniref:acylphosphatase n=1 Tax=Tepidamorphus gemmatus TaxID=747076 RepID=A0A4R3MGL9_9HYPH|nr:acylphosphatase [Tepidamorphus gemmatus]TCT12771.1 acylphosphatase [Tepidamorphus gemmatus]
MRTVHVRIEGLVQGVYYRAWTREQAEMLGVSGWVRNRRDGAVEALFAGDPERVAEMLARCRIGPRDARVRSVAILAEGGAAPDGFTVLPTV